MREIEVKLQNLPNSDGVKLRMLRTKPVHFYRMHDFMAVRHADRIIIQIPIPLGILANHLNLYEIMTVPMMTPGSETHATVLSGESMYIAYHPQAPFYMEFQDKPLITKSKLMFLEDSLTSLKSKTRPSCVLAILQNNRTQIDSLCKFTVVTHAIRPTTLILDRHHVLLTNISDAKLTCRGKQPENITCQETCRVVMHCGCSLNTSTAFIPARLQGCRISFTHARPMHSVNLPLLNQFFDKSDLAEIYANTLLPDPLKIIVPKLKIFEANYSHEVDQDKQARFDLTRLANLTKEDKEPYSSLAHSMTPAWLDFQSGDFDNNFNFWSWKSWITIGTGILAVCGFSLSILLSYKLRALTAVVTSLSFVPRVHTLPTELNYFLATISPQNVTNNVFFLDFKTDWYLDISVILILILILGVIVVKSLNRRKRGQYYFDLYLHIGFDTKSCAIWMKRMKLEPNLYNFSASSHLEMLEVRGCLQPKLCLKWPSLMIHSQVTAECYQLPKKVRLTWTQARAIRKFLSFAYWCILVGKTHKSRAIAGTTARCAQYMSAQIIM